jgi:hypothetical protein
MMLLREIVDAEYGFALRATLFRQSGDERGQPPVVSVAPFYFKDTIFRMTREHHI